MKKKKMKRKILKKNLNRRRLFKKRVISFFMIISILTGLLLFLHLSHFGGITGFVTFKGGTNFVDEKGSPIILSLIFLTLSIAIIIYEIFYVRKKR